MVNKVTVPAMVDAEIQKFVRGISEGYTRQSVGTDATIARRREIAEVVRKPWRTGGPPMARTHDFELFGIRLRLHCPVDRNGLPLLVYLHGGGWMLFSIDTHDRLMREYAHRADIAVLGIDYSLAPEARFPVALNEINAIVDWLQAKGASELGINASRIAIGGDSAGANLAVATSLKRRDSELEPLAGMLLSYGAFEPDRMPSYELYSGPDFTLEADEMDAFWQNYVTDPSHLDDPLVAPGRADLRGLPPAHLTIAECDILADSNIAFERALTKAGVSVESNLVHGATHSFLEAVSVSSLANRALNTQSEWLARILDPVKKGQEAAE